ncbi:MAG TPA: DUF2079 domain-containing protein [Candidatus Dormibacteraeota bacterium]|nr:DUF2079 domain-containing protein [Candidatus Dormibacteraeota bacterium]
MLPGLRHALDVLRARPGVAPLAAAALGFALVAATLLQRAAALQLPAYDTAFFEQLVWNLGHGRGLASGFYGGDFLGLHFSPLLALPAALELAWPDARLLALLQAAALALSAPAAYLLLRALLQPRPGAEVAAAALSAPLPFWLGLQEAARAGFHTEALALPLVLVAGWAGLRGRARLCCACALLALCAREDQAYAVAVIGLLIALHGPARRLGAALGLVGLAWGGLLELVVMPALRGRTTSDVEPYYAWLHHATPGQLATAATAPAGWLAFAAMVAGLAGLPLLRPGWLALALPPLLGDLLSAHAPQPQLHLQYALPLVVPVLVAGGLGARSLLDRARLLGRPRPIASLAALALPALVVGVALGPLVGQRPAAPAPVLDRLLACTSGLPPAAPVAVDDAAAAPLAARPVERPLTYGGPADWVVVDVAGPQPGYVNASARAAHLAALPAEGRRLYCDDGRFQLWGPARLPQRVGEAPPPALAGHFPQRVGEAPPPALAGHLPQRVGEG